MKHRFIKHNGEQRLLLFFTGWASFPEAHTDLTFDGYDTLVAYGYSDLEFDSSLFDSYREIVIVAWSYGVAVASHFIQQNQSLPITLRLAINGTVETVNDTHGIPEKIFNGTLAGLNARSLNKFYRRVCGSREATENFISGFPEADIRALTRELSALGELPAGEASAWDFAYISSEDYIIPTANQIAAWEAGKVPFEIVAGSHLADFKSLITSHILNKQLVGKRFGNSRRTYCQQAAIQREVTETMSAMLPDSCDHAIEIGAGIHPLTSNLDARRLTLVDLDISELPVSENITAIADDAELWIRSQKDSSADCIVSASTIQWFNSPARFVGEALRVLKPGGTLLVSTFADETFAGLREWTRQLPFLSVERWRELLPPTAEITAMRREMKFSDRRSMLRHITETGVNAITSSSHATVAARNILLNYPTEADGSCSLVYQPLIFKIIKQ